MQPLSAVAIYRPRSNRCGVRSKVRLVNVRFFGPINGRHPIVRVTAIARTPASAIKPISNHFPNRLTAIFLTVTPFRHTSASDFANHYRETPSASNLAHCPVSCKGKSLRRVLQLSQVLHDLRTGPIYCTNKFTPDHSIAVDNITFRPAERTIK